MGIVNEHRPKGCRACWSTLLVLVLWPLATLAEDLGNPQTEESDNEHNEQNGAREETIQEEHKTGQKDDVTIRPVPGWSRGAAIAGLVSVPVVAVLGVASIGVHSLGNWRLLLSLYAADYTLMAAMAPIIAIGANSTRRISQVSGSRAMRISGHITYTIGMAGGGIMNSFFLADDDFVPYWASGVWSGLGALGLLFYSIDAAISYEQAAESGRRQSPTGKSKAARPWTWTAFIAGGTAAVGATVTGIFARSRLSTWNDYETAEKHCLDKVVGNEKVGCSTHNEQDEARRLAVTTDVLIGVAAAGLVMGTALYFIEPKLRSVPTLGNVSLVPYAAPGRAGIALGGKF
ncbi:MAG: hypothetical protein GY847_27480 [Proteobacteria bacterium]|nr:hypothetical protein [Pseudomonadota bacterium]